LRCISQACSQTFLLIAFSMMPLAGATAINFSAPLFATLASALLLKEPVGPARWIALIAGFFGVLIVVQPGGDTLQVGALFALANAVLYGSVTLACAALTTTESTQTLTIYQLMLLTPFFAFRCRSVCVFADAGDAWMLLNGIFIAIGQYWTRALSLAPAVCGSAVHICR
jgi:drug/metabolite transporter (DMT)-like permease